MDYASRQEIEMISFKTISKAAAVISVALLASGFAQAQGLSSTTGSTDIYNTDFQKTFATGQSTLRAPSAAVAQGSTDIYTTDFQKAFSSNPEVKDVASAKTLSGSTDIYSTNFQIVFM
jgi:hypothetical protein